METKSKYKASQNFAIFTISMGVILILAAIVGGATIIVAFGTGILIHTFSDVRTNIIRIVFNFCIPLIGGIVMILAGFKLLKFDRQAENRSFVSNSRKNEVKKKEEMLNVFLNPDEKKVMDLIKENKGGVLQSDLVIQTGYSKVKMHRLLKNLENKELIKRGRFGITNKVLINR